MTVRRRFFPAKRAQAIPGPRVELAATLQPAAPPVAAPAPPPKSGCICDVAGVGWFPDWQVWCDNNTNGHVAAVDSSVMSSQLWPIVVPPTQEGLLQGAYTHIPQQYGDKPRFRGMVIGKSLCDIHWTWTLDVPEMPRQGSYVGWWDGIEIKEQDGTIVVRVLEGGDDYIVSDDVYNWFAELKATATCAGIAVGTLKLRFVYPRYNNEFYPDWNVWPGTQPIICPPDPA